MVPESSEPKLVKSSRFFVFASVLLGVSVIGFDELLVELLEISLFVEFDPVKVETTSY